MREKLAETLWCGLCVGLALGALLARGWRLWLGLALLGAVLTTALAWAAPSRWASEGTLLVRPPFLLEGYLLSASELGPHYAARLAAPARVERWQTQLGVAAPSRVQGWSEPGGLVHLRVEHPEPQAAERLTRALLNDLRAELEQENRSRREEADRPVLALSPTSFPFFIQPPLFLRTVQGAGVGLVLGLLGTLARGWWQRGRVSLPVEVEQLVGAPTLGAIPK